MIIETKEIYKCDFCRKLYQIKRFAEVHEQLCYKNPENNRPCYSCPNLEKRTTEIYYQDYNGHDMERNVDLLYCTSKEIFLYPPKVEYKKNWHDLDEETNEPMPRSCEIYDKQLTPDFVNLFGL